MPRIFVNGAERSGENMTGTWGDLLPAIEQDAAARGEVVSAAVRWCRRTGLDGTDWNGQPVSARLDRIAALLERLVEAQHAGDWVILAEVVEHDLHPLLASAAPLLDTLRRATHARV